MPPEMDPQSSLMPSAMPGWYSPLNGHEEAQRIGTMDMSFGGLGPIGMIMGAMAGGMGTKILQSVVKTLMEFIGIFYPPAGQARIDFAQTISGLTGVASTREAYQNPYAGLLGPPTRNSGGPMQSDGNGNVMGPRTSPQPFLSLEPQSPQLN